MERARTHVHSRVCHWHSLYPALVQLAQGHLGIESNGIEVNGEVDDIILIDRRRRRSRLFILKAFRQFASGVLNCLLPQLQPMFITFNSVLPLSFVTSSAQIQ